MKKKKHLYETTIYYEDTDAAGITYHTSFLRFAERARTEFIRSIYPEFLKTLSAGKFFFVLRNINVEYIKPCYLFDNISIETNIIKIKKTNIELNQLVKKKNEIACNIFLQLVWISKKKKKPSKIDQNLISRFMKHYNV